MAITDKPIRYTEQKRQERISRKQFGERLDEFGWIDNPPAEDLGQDFIVDVYFQGRATGVNFYVQLKSVTNLHERHKGDDLVYPFEVKDLKHWETFELPVALVVWDVELREGRWALVGTVIAELDRRRPRWRSNKTKTRVRIPWDNTTDDVGLVELRKSIGYYLFPLIAKPSGEVKVKFSFPGTQEGRTAWRAFDRWVKEGESAIIQGKFIKEFIPPQWQMQWFGEPSLDEGELTLGSPNSPKIYEVDVDFIGANGEPIAYRPIQLKIVKAGTEIVQLSNEHQALPLYFHLVVPRSSKCDDAHQSKPIQIKMSFDESYGELFGSKIQLGRMVRYITGMIEISTAELEQAIATLPPDESLSIKLVDVEVIEIFPDWYIREAQRLSQCLVDNFGAESVYLFGSLAWSDVHAPETDIDLAVSGLPSERYLEAVGYLERVSKFPVDLVNLDSVPDHLRQRILAEGKKLNECATGTA